MEPCRGARVREFGVSTNHERAAIDTQLHRIRRCGVSVCALEAPLLASMYFFHDLVRDFVWSWCFFCCCVLRSSYHREMIRGLGPGDMPLEAVFISPTSAVADVLASWNALYTDPWCLPSAFTAGVLARLAITPLIGFRGDKFATAFSVARQRGLYFAALSWFYFPVHRRAQWTDYNSPNVRMFRLVTCGAVAGGLARLITNPFIKMRAVSHTYGMDLTDAARNIKMSELGAAGFFTNEHPVFANAVYIACFFVFLEASRRLLDSFGLYPDNFVGRAFCHAALAGGSAAAASSITYPLSYHVYAGTMIRPSTILEGRHATLMKEVPMMASFFFIYSLIQPWACPHHERCGLGY
jgi:hypothetical protein